MQSVILSREDCYAGKRRLEVLPVNGYLYLQIVEGCGYTPVEMTAEEAVNLANILLESAVLIEPKVTPTNAIPN